MPSEKDYRNIASFLKHLKPLLDNVADHKAPLDEILCKECEKLDVAVNEAREFLEKWSPRMSKILFFCKLESQNLKLDKVSELIEEMLRSQSEGITLHADDLISIGKTLNLTSNQELLSEFIALENERIKAEENQEKGIWIKLLVPLSLCPAFAIVRLSLRTLRPCKSFGFLHISAVLYLSNSRWIQLLLLLAKPPEHISHEDDLQCPLQMINSTSRSSFEVGHGFEKQNVHGFSGLKDERYGVLGEKAVEKFDHSSSEHSYVHNRSESTSSAVSSIDYLPKASTDASRISSKHYDMSDRSGDRTSSFPTRSTSNKNSGSESTELHTAAAEKLRRRHNRTLCPCFETGNAGAKENAAAALFSLSLLDGYRIKISQSGAVNALVDLLRSGAVKYLVGLMAPETEMSVLQEGAVPPLVALSQSSTPRTKEKREGRREEEIFMSILLRLVAAFVALHLQKAITKSCATDVAFMGSSILPDLRPAATSGVGCNQSLLEAILLPLTLDLKIFKPQTIFPESDDFRDTLLIVSSPPATHDER
ncbi:unnamed protein product [Fraxinus pennsylvanica]|uniref:PUB2-4-like N-terminal domain-containing protein n=1 Tax=Fraxinus pennsylvanica TaxID=56036 RepID=A0AAD2ECP3_9LAMI|nr:unnamed protein product [Fraxinus pennsylvanica]